MERNSGLALGHILIVEAELEVQKHQISPRKPRLILSKHDFILGMYST